MGSFNLDKYDFLVNVIYMQMALKDMIQGYNIEI